MQVGPGSPHSRSVDPAAQPARFASGHLCDIPGPISPRIRLLVSHRCSLAGVGEMEDEVAALRAEVARLTALLRLTRPEAGPPRPVQSAVAAPHTGLLTAASPAAAKIALFTDLFATRSDVHAVRWENQRKGTSGWMPAARGRWRRGRDTSSADLLPLTPKVVADHLTGTIDLGLYSIAPGDTCRWLAADFDGPFAMLDALAYLKAARAAAVPAVLEVSRSGEGAHAWVFFAEQVPAVSARQLGFGLLREAMGIRGRMSLASYDRFFPSQDVLPAAGFGNLIAAPLQGRCRARGATSVPELGDDGAARGSVGVAVVGGPDVGASRGTGGWAPQAAESGAVGDGPGGCERHPNPTPRPGGSPSPHRRAGDSDRRRFDPLDGRDSAARGVDPQPAVRPAAAPAAVHVGRAPIHHRLRRDRRRRPGAAARTAAAGRAVGGRAGVAA